MLGGAVVAAVHGPVVGEVSAGVALQPGPGARRAEDVTRAAGDKINQQSVLKMKVVVGVVK